MASLAIPFSSTSDSSLHTSQPTLAIHSWRPGPKAAESTVSFNDVVEICNKFDHTAPDGLWQFCVLDYPVPVGYMPTKFVKEMSWAGTSFQVSEYCLKVHLNPDVGPDIDVVEVCRREFVQLCERNATGFNGSFTKWLRKKTDFHVLRLPCGAVEALEIPSPLRGIFGVVTTGVHMTMFTRKKINGRERMYIWVSKRSPHVTYAGKLDQLAAGAMDPTDKLCPLHTLKREAEEEAGLTLNIASRTMSKDGRLVGKVEAGNTIFFYDQKDKVAGIEEGHIEPGMRYTFDLEVDSDFIPEPTEPEAIDGFYLKSIDEVKRDLKKAEWKPNCGLVMLDFLLRKGEIKPEEDENFRLLAPRLKRELPFYV